MRHEFEDLAYEAGYLDQINGADTSGPASEAPPEHREAANAAYRRGVEDAVNEAAKVRTAEVWGARDEALVAAYLPHNYRVTGSEVRHEYGYDNLVVTIEGTDDAGWTMDDYVIPRLGSGLLGCRETTGGSA